MPTIKNLKFKIKNSAPISIFILCGCFAIPIRAQDASQSAATTTTGQIKNRIHQGKKDLEAIEQKLSEEEKRKRQDEVKEKKELGRLQAVDQTLGKLRREKQANEEDLMKPGQGWRN